MLFVTIFLLVSCSESHSTKYIKFSNLDLMENLSSIESCLKDAGVKYKIQNNAIYVDDPDSTADNCS